MHSPIWIAPRSGRRARFRYRPRPARPRGLSCPRLTTSQPSHISMTSPPASTSTGMPEPNPFATQGAGAVRLISQIDRRGLVRFNSMCGRAADASPRGVSGHAIYVLERAQPPHQPTYTRTQGGPGANVARAKTPSPPRPHTHEPAWLAGTAAAPPSAVAQVPVQPATLQQQPPPPPQPRYACTCARM